MQNNNPNQNDKTAVSLWQLHLKNASQTPWFASLLLKQAQRRQKQITDFFQRLATLPHHWQQHIRRSLAASMVGAALLLAWNPTPSVHAANITVGGNCSLVEAIHNANDITTGQPYADCAAGNPSGADTLYLSGNINLSGSYGSGTQLPHITSTITIEGGGATIQGDGFSGTLMRVTASGDLTLNQTNVTGGYTTASGPGGIWNQGTLALNNSTVRNNYTATTGGGIANYGAMTTNNSTISDNSVGINGYGGGLANYGSATLTNSTISGNSTGINGYGGGIHNGDTLILNNVTITGNSSANGGGLNNAFGTVTLNQSLISGNSASVAGSEIRRAAGTITANNFNLLGHNGLNNAQAFVGFTPGSSDITATSNGTDSTPLNGILNTSLANNGGGTNTHGLVSGSPAVDGSPVNPGLPTDQRSVARPQGARWDIGAVESVTFAHPAEAEINGSQCLLADAIIAANSDTAYATCNAGTGADTITLLGNVTLSGASAPNTQLPFVTSAITIEGGGATIQGDGSSGTLMRVTASGDLTLNQTTVTGGYTTGSGPGGIWNQGTLALNNSTVRNNYTATTGGGISNYGTLTANNSTISNNNSGDYGGGIANYGSVTLTNSTISGNIGSNMGGGIFSNGSSLILNNSTITGNSSANGGGLNNAFGTVTLNQSLISGNSASVAGNEIRVSGGTTTADNFNLLGHNGLNNAQAFVGFTPGSSDITATSNGTDSTPLNGILNTSLANNGGTTNTHNLVSGSPAVDGSPVNPGLPTDQRSVARPQGARWDIGAVESVTFAHPAEAEINGSQCLLADAIIAANSDTAYATCNAGTGADTIALLGNVTLSGASAPNTQLPFVTSAMTIEGGGATIQGDGASGTLMRVTASGDLTLNQTTVTGGYTTGNTGGIRNEGNLTLNNSTIRDNDTYSSGGGITNIGTLIANNSTISGNSVSNNGYGGGIANYGSATLTNSTISGNYSSDYGGGINNAGGNLILNSCTITGNSSANGGGLNISSGTVTLNQSLISGNSASVTGSEIRESGGTTTADNFNLFGDISLTDIQAFNGFIPGANDITATSNGTTPTALLSILNPSLANNGGDTRTHALASSSPAIDVIATNATTCNPPNTVDQRGAVRADGNNRGGTACDIGAYEVSNETPTAVSLQSFSSQTTTTTQTGFVAVLLAGLTAVTLGIQRRFKK